MQRKNGTTLKTIDIKKEVANIDNFKHKPGDKIKLPCGAIMEAYSRDIAEGGIAWKLINGSNYDYLYREEVVIDGKDLIY